MYFIGRGDCVLNHLIFFIPYQHGQPLAVMESGGHNGIRTDWVVFLVDLQSSFIFVFNVWKLWQRSCELCHFVFGSSLNAVVHWICDFMRQRIPDKKSSMGKKESGQTTQSVTAGLSLRGPYWRSEWVRWACMSYAKHRRSSCMWQVSQDTCHNFIQSC